jgi:hypothetical protein
MRARAAEAGQSPTDDSGELDPEELDPEELDPEELGTGASSAGSRLKKARSRDDRAATLRNPGSANTTGLMLPQRS